MEMAVDLVVLLSPISNVLEFLEIFLNARKQWVPFVVTMFSNLKNSAIMVGRQVVRLVSSKNRGNATRLLDPPLLVILKSIFQNVETVSTILITLKNATMGTFNTVMGAPVYARWS